MASSAWTRSPRSWSMRSSPRPTSDPTSPRAWTRSHLSTDGPDRVRDLRGPGVVAAGQAQGLRQRAGRVPQPGRARPGRPRHREEGRLGSRAGRVGADGGPSRATWTLARTEHEDADTEEAASCLLRVTVRDPDKAKVGKAFSAPLVELALASYPGFTLTGPPAPATPYGVYTGRLCRTPAGRSSWATERSWCPRRLRPRVDIARSRNRSFLAAPAHAPPPAAPSAGLGDHAPGASGLRGMPAAATRAGTRTSGCGPWTRRTARTGWGGCSPS